MDQNRSDKLEFSHAARMGKFYVSRNGFILKQNVAPYVFCAIGLDRKFEIKIGRFLTIKLDIYSLYGQYFGSRQHRTMSNLVLQ